MTYGVGNSRENVKTSHGVCGREGKQLYRVSQLPTASQTHHTHQRNSRVQDAIFGDMERVFAIPRGLWDAELELLPSAAEAA